MRKYSRLGMKQSIVCRPSRRMVSLTDPSPTSRQSMSVAVLSLRVIIRYRRSRTLGRRPS